MSRAGHVFYQTVALAVFAGIVAYFVEDHIVETPYKDAALTEITKEGLNLSLAEAKDVPSIEVRIDRKILWAKNLKNPHWKNAYLFWLEINKSLGEKTLATSKISQNIPLEGKE